MFEIIKCSYRHDPAATKEIENGRYTLYHDGQPVPPASWDDFVGPGRSVGLKLWKDEAIHLKDAVGRRYNLPWGTVKTWKVSRTFSQPMYFFRLSLWMPYLTGSKPSTQGFEAILKQAFLFVEILGPLVHQGRYDLVGPDDTLILPVAWEQVIKPGMSIEMRVWHVDVPLFSRLYRLNDSRVSQPPLAECLPLRPKGFLASQQAHQKQDTGPGYSPKKI